MLSFWVISIISSISPFLIGFCISISSLSITIIGFTLAAVGYKEQFPQLHEDPTPVIFWTTMFLFIGIPKIGRAHV